MDKKNKKLILPLNGLPKSTKKGKKTTDKEIDSDQLLNYMQEENSKEAEQSQSSEPQLKKLKKFRKVEEEKQRLVKEKQKSKEKEKSDGSGSEYQASQEEEIQYERFHKVDDKDLQKIQNDLKNKKGKNRKRKSEQQIKQFIQNHKTKLDKSKQKNNTKEPKPQKKFVQQSLQAMFFSSSQPKLQTNSNALKTQEERNKQSSSESQDSLQIYRKKNAMKNMSTQNLSALNAGLNQQQAIKAAIRQSQKQMKMKQKQMKQQKTVRQHIPLDIYSFENVNKNKLASASYEMLQSKTKQEKQTIQPKNQPKQKQPSYLQTQKQKQKKLSKNTKKQPKSDNQQKKGSLSGLGIVITGQIQPYSRNQMLQLLQQHGAITPNNITKKTTHLLQGNCVKNTYGRVTGQDVKTTSKSMEAAQKGITIIAFEDLDAFFVEKTGKTLDELINKDKPKLKETTIQRYVQINKNPSAVKNTTIHQPQQMQQQLPNPKKRLLTSITLPWTQKYKPLSSEQIIGQTTQIKNLKQWLSIWQDIHIRGNKRDVKPNFNSFMPSGTINSNAALLSGDAGLGKTTTARLVATEFGYSVVQYNASDARNKKSVGIIGAGKDNMSMMDNKQKEMAKTLIIMDQVDGMSSGDRGGISAIIDMIKKTKVPIICICNDRQSTKIRSLAGHCFDIKFHKPDRNKIVQKLQKIVREQGGTSNPIALRAIVQQFQNDMRQIISYLQFLFKSGCTNITTQTIQKHKNTKDSTLTLNFFQATKTLLTHTIFSTLNIHQRVELAFIDSDMVPLMVQENYLSAAPKKKLNSKEFHKLVKATEGFVSADLIDRSIMKGQNFCLMPNKMFMGCVYPCEMICENMGFPKFSQWLGKFSSERKNKRLIRQLKYSLSTVTPVTFHSVKYNLSIMLYQIICQQLKTPQPDTQKIVKFMLHYNITPTTLTEHLMTLQYGQRQNLYKDIQTSKKTKLTKLYNKMSQVTKFKKGKGESKGTVGETHLKFNSLLGEMEEEGGGNQEQEEGDGEGNEDSVSDVIVDKKGAAKSKAKKKK